MFLALTRAIADSIVRCELTHLARSPIDVSRARQQHAQYEAALQSLGVQVRQLPAAAEFPDSVFIEDTALITLDLAIITRPGAASRRGETAAVAAALRPLCPLAFLEAPATADGGDLLLLGRRLLVGLSSRTNHHAVEQFRELLKPQNYQVEGVALSQCLHLKSAVTQVADNMVLLNPAWIDPAIFHGHQIIEIDPAEPHAANALRVQDTLIFPAHFPHTAQRLKSCGLKILSVPADELAKAEGAVTCCSLILETR